MSLAHLLSSPPLSPFAAMPLAQEVSSSADWIKQAASIAKRKLEDSGDRKVRAQGGG